MTSIQEHFVEQLRSKLVQKAASAKRAEIDARQAARTIATESEKKEDGRVAIEFGSLAKGHFARSREAQQEVSALDTLVQHGLPKISPQSPVCLGAIVDVATEDARGIWERTFILLPVGAATGLDGPGGDGFVTVITPASPVGKALLGKRAGDVADVTLNREPFEWEVLAVS